MGPLTEIAGTVRSLASNVLSRRVDIPSCARARLVASTFGGVIGHVGVLSRSERRFMSGISRRLGAPLASVGILTSSLIKRRKIPRRLCRRFVDSVATRVSERGGVVASLLSLMGVSGGTTSMGVARVSVGRLLRSVLGHLHPVTSEHGVSLVLSYFQPISTSISRIGFALTIDGLIRGNVGCGISSK